MTRTLKTLAYALLLVAALFCLERAAHGQYYPRFHRYAMTQLDATTTLDMVKDAKTGVCRLVYLAHMQEAGGYYRYQNSVAVAYLGEVPCDPAPVPPKRGDAPPASAVR